MIDEQSKSLCGHLKATLSGFIPDSEIQAFVGRLNNMTTNTYKDVTDEISAVFSAKIAGLDAPAISDTPHLQGFYASEEDERLNNPSYGGAFKIISDILNLPLDPVCSQKIWAGMTNLKSVIYRETSCLSRKDKRKAFYNITHTTEIDEKTISEWDSFVDEYVPYLIEGMVIPEREYLPVSFIPASDKHLVFIDENGKAHSMKRTDDHLFDMNHQMRIPAIQRLALMDPSQFISRTYIGEEVVAEWDEASFPDPFPEEVPIGMNGIAPKNGQKPRVVGSTIPVMASLSYPIGKILKSINTQTRIQWVDDQEGAKEDLQRSLLISEFSGHPEEFTSFDQSSFTDNFSYEKIQRKVILKLRDLQVLNDFDVAIVDTVSTGLYDMNTLRKGFTGQYGTGTPMGSYPSFPLASMCNGLLTAWAYTKVYGHFPSKGDTFSWIVGDDCVIRNRPVGLAYEQICDDIGLKINRSKSIVSTSCIEFCSVFITCYDIYQKKKIPRIEDNGGIMEAIRYYGPSNFVSGFPKFRRATHDLLRIPKPYGLGEEVDVQSEPSPFPTLRNKVQAKVRSGQLDNLQDDVNRAREHAHAMARSGLVARGRKRPLPKFTSSSRLGSGNSSKDSGPALTQLEKSKLETAGKAVSCLNAVPYNSEIAHELCMVIDKIYRYFREVYPDELERVRTIYKIAPPSDQEDDAPVRDTQQLLNEIRTVENDLEME